MHEQKLDMAFAMFNPDTGTFEIPPPEFLTVQVFMRSNDISSNAGILEEELKLVSCAGNSYHDFVPDSEKGYVLAGACIDEEDK